MKKLIAGILSVTLVFGSLALPAEVTEQFGFGTAITANAAETDFLRDINDDGTVTITKYTGSETNVVIPDYLGGRKVTAITGQVTAMSGSSGFMYNKNIKSIKLPKYLKTTGNYSFYGCTALETVIFNDSLTEIGTDAFSNCSSLKNVKLPNKLKKIGVNAFDDCSALSSITIPDSVTTLGGYAFSDCSNLSKITLSKNITAIERDMFFDCSKLESIVIPQGVTFIGRDAFHNCTSLREVSMPSSLESIGYWSFQNCTSLKSVRIPDNVSSIGSGAFLGCTNLSSVQLSNSLTKIKDDAFYNCNLTYIYLPRTIEEIEDRAIGYKDKQQIPNFKIYCYLNTAGESYAMKKGFDYHVHTFRNSVVKPTYASAGYTLHKCSCGVSYKDSYKAKKTVPKTAVSSKYTYAPDAVRINWNKVNGASGYKIFMYNDSTKKWDVVGRIFNNNTFNFRKAGLKSGKAYKFKVQAFVKSGDNYYYGATSNTISTATSPAQVKVSRSNSANDAVRIYWNKVSCSGYKVQQYNPTAKKWVTIAKVSGTATNYRVAGLKRRTAYKFRVQPYKADGAGTFAYGAVSNTYTAKTL